MSTLIWLSLESCTNLAYKYVDVQTQNPIQVNVVRNDEFTEQEASQLIPGDVINIEPGMTVPVRDHRH